MSRTSVLVLPLQLAETFRVCAPTMLDGLRGRIDRGVVDARLDEWAKNALRLAEVQLDVRGLEHVRDAPSHLLMSNHQSAYDIFTLFVAFPHSLRMVAKKAMFSLPIMGQGMRAAGFIEIDRRNRARALAALEAAKATMASGIHVWIAPEGTRSDDGKLLPFKKGGFVMALQTGAPILPVTIDGTRDVLPAKDYRVRRGRRVTITYHAPIDPRDYGPDGREPLMGDVRRAIGSALSTEP